MRDLVRSVFAGAMIGVGMAGYPVAMETKPEIKFAPTKDKVVYAMPYILAGAGVGLLYSLSRKREE